jgi:serine/threonine-protein kinase
MADRDDDDTHVDPEKTESAPARDAALDPVDARSPSVPMWQTERYDAIAPLGAGGMGEVRACRDEHLGRIVAMKTLIEDGLDRSSLSRFMREARIQAQLEHPAIVPVYDLGVHGQSPFLTMKRVRGTTLASALGRLARGEPEAAEEFPLRRLLGAFATVCLAVEYAHSRGVVHRDIKPANVMLGDFGEVYLLDWGIAKILGQTEDDAAKLQLVRSDESDATEAGTLLGTPRYAPPEQLRGDPDLDARADVYALGAVLFEILALAPLHAGIALEDRVKPKQKRFDLQNDPRALARAAPPELLAVCEDATASDPAERTPSARALHDAVDRYLAGERDRALQIALSKEHAKKAETLTARAIAESSLERREEAIREVSRALALDPRNGEATHAFLSLLASTPEKLPPEVEAGVEKGQRETLSRLGSASSVSYAVFGVLVPIGLWMGVRDWSLAGPTIAMFVAAAAAMTFFSRRVLERGPAPFRAPIVAASISLTVVSTIFGPYIFVPAMAAVNTTFFIINNKREVAPPVIGLGLLPIVLPVALQALGVIPPAYVFDGGTIRLMPLMLEFRPLATDAFLFVSNVLIVLVAAFISLRYQSLLSDARRDVELQAWHLRRLLPSDATVTARKR